jgi:HK97 family phage portal protein
MAKFLRGLYAAGAREPRITDKKNPLPRVVNGMRSMYSTQPSIGAWDLEQAVNNGLERVIWVYRCVDAIASNGSTVPMVVRKFDDYDGEIIKDPDINKLLNRRPNTYETSAMFRYRMISQLLLSRRGAFVEVVWGRDGRPKQLHLLSNENVRPIVNQDQSVYVSGYEVITRDGTVTLPPERVLWLRVKPHPTDPYAQMTPLVAAGIAADTDYLARVYNRNFLMNDGRPGMLIALGGGEGGLNQEDALEIKRRFSGGPEYAGKTTVVEADSLTATDLAASPRDVQWTEAVQGSKEDILLAFGTPLSILGDSSQRTFDNADAEWENWWEITMLPLLDGTAAGFDPLTKGGIDDEEVVAHDYSYIEVLQRKKRQREDRAVEMYQAGIITLDDLREAIKMEKLNIPASRVLWLPPGNVPTGGEEGDLEAVQKLVAVGPPVPPDPAEQARQGALQGVQQGVQNQQSALFANQNYHYMNGQYDRAQAIAGKKELPIDEAIDAEVVEDPF